MWNIEYRDPNGKGFSETEPWVETEIETQEELNDILESMKRRGCLDIKVIDLNAGCNCCDGDEAVYWQDNENNAFVDSKGEMMVTVKDKLIRFKAKYCPCCGKKF